MPSRIVVEEPSVERLSIEAENLRGQLSVVPDAVEHPQDVAPLHFLERHQVVAVGAAEHDG